MKGSQGRTIDVSDAHREAKPMGNLNSRNRQSANMNTQPTSKNRVNIILIILVLVNIIGDIGNIIIWQVDPTTRSMSLNTGYIANTAGVENALLAGDIILAVVAIVYLAALFGLFKKASGAPLLVIAISVANRTIAAFLYLFTAAFFVWALWTVVLVVVAVLDYRRLSVAHS